jgi:hypothetical protein
MQDSSDVRANRKYTCDPAKHMETIEQRRRHELLPSTIVIISDQEHDYLRSSIWYKKRHVCYNTDRPVIQKHVIGFPENRFN